MKPIYMETSRSPQECADILQHAITATDDKTDATNCCLRSVDGVLSVDMQWQGRLALGVDLAGGGTTTFVRIRYGTGPTVRLAMGISLPVTIGAFLVAGWLLPQPLIPDVSNILTFGVVGVVVALIEVGLLWTMLNLPTLKLMRELGKALGAEEVTGPRQADAAAAFESLDSQHENPSS